MSADPFIAVLLNCMFALCSKYTRTHTRTQLVVGILKRHPSRPRLLPSLFPLLGEERMVTGNKEGTRGIPLLTPPIHEHILVHYPRAIKHTAATLSKKAFIEKYKADVDFSII